MNAHAVVKAPKPGKFGSAARGISQSSTPEQHAHESELALRSIIEEFASPYARSPKPMETIEGKMLHDFGEWE